MSVIADLSIFPLDKGTSLSQYVARAEKIIDASGLDYRLGPMGTSMEGEWDQVVEVISKCFKDMEGDSERIYMTVKFDYRKGRSNGLQEKVSSVRDKI